MFDSACRFLKTMVEEVSDVSRGLSLGNRTSIWTFDGDDSTKNVLIEVLSPPSQIQLIAVCFQVCWEVCVPLEDAR